VITVKKEHKNGEGNDNREDSRVKVPVENEKTQERAFKTYKVLKKLEY
jgi:hypothetical protein